MEIRFVTPTEGVWHCECALVMSFEGEDVSAMVPAFWETVPWASIAPAMRDITAKADSFSVLHGHPELPTSRIAVVGLGKREKLTVATVRAAVSRAVQQCRTRQYLTIGMPLELVEALAKMLDMSSGNLLQECLVAASTSLYRCTKFRSEQPKADEQDPRWFGLLLAEGTVDEALNQAVRHAEAEVQGVVLARDLVNAPGNALTPSGLAEKARELAEQFGFKCTVFEEQAIRDKGMGALWAVGRGSQEPPQFVVLEYSPKGKENTAPVAFVGKGITFDSGGISLKPAAGMHEMKGDMGGAAAVLGLFAAIGNAPDKEDLPRIIGVVPCAENMPDGAATRPGDVVKTLSGKTVEILNTDAEGRLILCDALTFVQQEYKPAFLVDIATLTGACVVALGDIGAGVFSADAALRDAFMAASQRDYALFWPLPLWEEYDLLLKSDVADFANIGTRNGGALQAALFLQRFIEKDARWIHVDIAGPDSVSSTSAMHSVTGATGVGVRSFYGLIRSLPK